MSCALRAGCVGGDECGSACWARRWSKDHREHVDRSKAPAVFVMCVAYPVWWWASSRTAPGGRSA